jgi:hypothetical protein
LLWLITSMALLLLGAGAMAAAAALDQPLRAEPVGDDTSVNAAAGDPADIRAHNSPSLARDPTDPSRIVVVNRIDTPRFSCALHASGDGGATWTHTDVPIPEGQEDKCFAPDVAFDAAGTLYVSYVTLQGRGNTPSAVWLSTSQNGGRTLSPPKRIGDELSFQVQLRTHPREPERLYLSWLDAETVGTRSLPHAGQPLMSAVSDDGGASWSEPVRLDGPAHQRALAPSPAVSPDGTWYVAYLDLQGDRLNYHGAHEGRGGPPPQGPWKLVVARSSDAGHSWTQTTVDELVPTERFLVFLPPLPQLAVDGDTVYLAFHDGRRNADGAPTAADVWLWTSPDSGRSWGAPVRVNDNPAADGTRQSLPQLALASNGRLDVLYYDRRGDPEDNVLTDASLQASADRGETFTPRVRLSDQAFDSRIGFGSSRGLPELGTRLALASTDSRALAVWADTRAGTPASGKQDLAQATVAFSGGRLAPTTAVRGLGYGGAAMGALGLVLALAWLWARRSVGHRGGGPPRSAI